MSLSFTRYRIIPPSLSSITQNGPLRSRYVFVTDAKIRVNENRNIKTNNVDVVSINDYSFVGDEYYKTLITLPDGYIATLINPFYLVLS